MENQVPTVEKGVEVQAERLMIKRNKPYHQPHPGPMHRPIGEGSNVAGHRGPPVPSQNSKEFQESDHQNNKSKQGDGQTKEEMWEQHPNMDKVTEKAMIRCRSFRMRGHKRSQCPVKKARGKAKTAKRSNQEDRQHNKKRKLKHHTQDGTLQKPRDAHSLSPRNNFRSGPS
jgi:hypothetical protein